MEPNTVSQQPPKNSLATASMILGIISLVTLFCVYPAFILGGIAIPLAILSRGKEHSLSSQARTGMITASIGVVASIAVLIGIVVMMMNNSDFLQLFQNASEGIYEEYPYSDQFPFSDDSPYSIPSTPGSSQENDSYGDL